MSFPKASDLRRKSKGAGYIEDYIRDILNSIRDDVLQAVERRSVESLTELPTDFDIPTMEPAEAQRMIYYFVAKKLEEYGYIPTFKYTGVSTQCQRWWITTRWMTDQDTYARKHMDKYINSRTEYTAPAGEEDIVIHRRRQRLKDKDKKAKDKKATKNKTTTKPTRDRTKERGNSTNPIFGRGYNDHLQEPSEEDGYTILT